MKTISLAITLFFVLDPFGNLPVVLSLVSHLPKKRQWKVVIRESIIALITLLLFYAAGPWFLGALEVGASDLQICGGVVLGIIALRLVFPDEKSNTPKESLVEPFIVPLAIPCMVGPSALATVMIMAGQSSGKHLITIGMMSLAWLVSAGLLLLGVVVGAMMSAKLMVALERLSGLLLSVISVHMIMTGIQTYFK
jgi:multiple antibiotic resistance protein